MDTINNSEKLNVQRIDSWTDWVAIFNLHHDTTSILYDCMRCACCSKI